MFILIDPVSKPMRFVAFDQNRHIIACKQVSIEGKEFDLFLPTFEEFVVSLGSSLQSIEGISCVRWPAGFTAIRIITLTLASLALSYQTPLFSLDYFELAVLAGWKYPVAVLANREEMVIMTSSENAPELIRKDDFAWEQLYWNLNESDFAGRKISIESNIDYVRAIEWLDLTHAVKRIEPFYVKKPNIT